VEAATEEKTDVDGNDYPEFHPIDDLPISVLVEKLMPAGSETRRGANPAGYRKVEVKRDGSSSRMKQ
jgi:hypothetical protein